MNWEEDQQYNSKER